MRRDAVLLRGVEAGGEQASSARAFFEYDQLLLRSEIRSARPALLRSHPTTPRPLCAPTRLLKLRRWSLLPRPSRAPRPAPKKSPASSSHPSGRNRTPATRSRDPSAAVVISLPSALGERQPSRESLLPASTRLTQESRRSLHVTPGHCKSRARRGGIVVRGCVDDEAIRSREGGMKGESDGVGSAQARMQACARVLSALNVLSSLSRSAVWARDGSNALAKKKRTGGGGDGARRLEWVSEWCWCGWRGRCRCPAGVESAATQLLALGQSAVCVTNKQRLTRKGGISLDYQRV